MNHSNISPLNNLSKREIEVMELLVINGCVKSVARQLNLSPRTIEMHINHIKEKLNLIYKHQFNGIIIEQLYHRKEENF